jgi:hypothetical protein
VRLPVLWPHTQRLRYLQPPRRPQGTRGKEKGKCGRPRFLKSRVLRGIIWLAVVRNHVPRSAKEGIKSLTPGGRVYLESPSLDGRGKGEGDKRPNYVCLECTNILTA